MKDKKEFGLFIQAKRKAKGYSQAEFASMLYVSESAVSKWERGVTYPDITLISDICQFLEISEHEFLTASNDLEFRKMKKDAKRLNSMSKAYFYTLIITYSIAILTCFICNLACNKTLSWFFIVLFGILTSFTLFPSISRFVNKFKLLLVSGSFMVSLWSLLFTCSVYTDNYSWILIAICATLLAYVIVFVPIFIKIYNLPLEIKNKKWFYSLCVDVVALILLLLVINIITDGTWFFIASASIIYGMLYLLIPMVIYTFNVPKTIKNNKWLFILGIYYLMTSLFILIINVIFNLNMFFDSFLVISFVFLFVFGCFIVGNKKYFLGKCKSFNRNFRFASVIFVGIVGVLLSIILFGNTTGIDLLSWSSENINSNIMFIQLVVWCGIGLVSFVIGVVKYLEER